MFQGLVIICFLTGNSYDISDKYLKVYVQNSVHVHVYKCSFYKKDQLLKKVSGLLYLLNKKCMLYVIDIFYEEINFGLSC